MLLDKYIASSPSQWGNFSHLAQKMHINYICREISESTGTVCEARFYVPCNLFSYRIIILQSIHILPTVAYL